LVACAAMLLICTLVEALPITEDEVVPEDDALFSVQDDGEDIRGSSDINTVIAQKTREEHQAKAKEWKELGFITNSVIGPLKKAILKNKDEETVDGHSVVSSMVDFDENDEGRDSKDIMVGLFHDAVKDAKTSSEAKASPELVRTTVESSDDAVKTPRAVHVFVSGRVALEPVHTAAKTAKKAVQDNTATKEQAKKPEDKKLAAIDAQEAKIISKEMRKDDHGNVRPTLTVKQDTVATSAHGAAADAAIAARKAVGALEEMKAEADNTLAASRVQQHQPSKAAVAAKIMEEARKSAAKTIAKLDKKEAQKQRTGAAQLAALTELFLSKPAPVVAPGTPGLISKDRDEQIQRQLNEKVAREDVHKVDAVHKVLASVSATATKETKKEESVLMEAPMALVNGLQSYLPFTIPNLD